MRFILPICLMLMGTPAAAQNERDDRVPAASTTFGQVKGWTVKRRQHDCQMYIGYSRDVVLFIRYDQRRGDVVLALADPSLKSLVMGKTYPLDVHFLSSRKPVESYLRVGFMPTRSDDELRSLAAKFDPDVLDDLAKHEVLVILRDSATIANLSLEGSSSAVEMLKQCAQGAATSDPSDPFAS